MQLEVREEVADLRMKGLLKLQEEESFGKCQQRENVNELDNMVNYDVWRLEENHMDNVEVLKIVQHQGTSEEWRSGLRW